LWLRVIEIIFKDAGEFMKVQETRELTEKERLEKISDLSQEYFNLRFQLATGKIENPGRLKFIRRDIARLKTIVKETKLVGSMKEVVDKA
jgi:large subunit ribosomal protein L29